MRAYLILCAFVQMSAFAIIQGGEPLRETTTPYQKHEPDSLEQMVVIMEGEDRGEQMPKVEFVREGNQLDIYMTHDQVYRHYRSMPNTDFSYRYYHDGNIEVICTNPNADEWRSLSYEIPIGARECIASIYIGDIRKTMKNVQLMIRRYNVRVNDKQYAIITRPMIINLLSPESNNVASQENAENPEAATAPPPVMNNQPLVSPSTLPQTLEQTLPTLLPPDQPDNPLAAPPDDENREQHHPSEADG